MPEITSIARIVLTTAGSMEEAERLGRSLVEERLAACATILPAAQSIYRWQGDLETAPECVLLLKTTVECLAPLEARLHALHSYQTPEFIVIDVERGSQNYLDWLVANVSKS